MAQQQQQQHPSSVYDIEHSWHGEEGDENILFKAITLDEVNNEDHPDNVLCCGDDTTSALVNALPRRAAVQHQEQERITSNSAQQRKQAARRAKQALYIFSVVAHCSEQIWQFTIVLFLAAFCNFESLVLVSTFGIVTTLSAQLFGSTIARRCLSCTSSFSASVCHVLMICTKNASVLIAAAMSHALLQYLEMEEEEEEGKDEKEAENVTLSSSSSSTWMVHVMSHLPVEYSMSLALLIGIHIFGAIARTLDRAVNSSIIQQQQENWVERQEGKPKQHSQQKNDSPNNKCCYPKMMINLNVSTSDGTESTASSSSTCSSSSSTSFPEFQKDQFDDGSDDDENDESTTKKTVQWIDLSAKVFGPAIVGIVVAISHHGLAAVESDNEGDGSDNEMDHHHRFSLLKGAALLIGWSTMAAMIIELICFSFLNHHHNHQSNSKYNSSVLSTVTKKQQQTGTSQSSSNGCISPLSEQIQEYIQQPVSMGGIGLALLYVNVLTFDGIMTAFLVWKGVRVELVGILAAVVSAVALTGPFVYRFASERLTQVTIGMGSAMFQFMFLSLSFGALLFLVDEENNDNDQKNMKQLSMVLLVIGTSASRVGLWVFERSVRQLMTDFIPCPVRRASVERTQESLNALFQMLSFGLAFVFPDPRQFETYASAGYPAVVLAVMFYAVGILQRANDFATPLSSERMGLLPGDDGDYPAGSLLLMSAERIGNITKEFKGSARGKTKIALAEEAIIEAASTKLNLPSSPTSSI